VIGGTGIASASRILIGKMRMPLISIMVEGEEDEKAEQKEKG